MPTKTSKYAGPARRTKNLFRVHPPGTPESRRSLARALAYRNRHVVDRFVAEYPMPREDAEEIFRELKRWLWLGGQVDDSLGITKAIAIVDAMWHTFILFTIDYAKFCDTYLGGMCHHRPQTHAESARALQKTVEDPEAESIAWGRTMRRQYELIAAYLGRATLTKWYVDFPKRYPPRVLAKLKRQGLAGV